MGVSEVGEERKTKYPIIVVPCVIPHRRHIVCRTLLGMVSVFQENRVRIHVKFMFAWKTIRLFPTQTKRKHNKIIPSVFAQKWKTV